MAERIPLLLIARVGFLIALYLGLYQLDVFSTVCDPFFGNGTKKILTSSISRSLPVPDALIGAFGYLCHIVLVSAGVITAGNQNRGLYSCIRLW